MSESDTADCFIHTHSLKYTIILKICSDRSIWPRKKIIFFSMTMEPLLTVIYLLCH